jgi:hypothetical protein
VNLAQRIVVISTCAVIAVILLAGGVKQHRSMDVARTATLVGGIVAVAVAVAVALGSAQITRAFTLGCRSATHGLGRAFGIIVLVLVGVSVAAFILWLTWLATKHGVFGTP